MKKFILSVIFIMFTFCAFSQTHRCKASSFAIGERDSSGAIAWGEWEPTDIILTINLDDNFIKVYSQKEQNYVIVEYGEEYREDEGTNINMTAVDEEGIECEILFRVQDDGEIQLYSFYSNVAWVYSGLKPL